MPLPHVIPRLLILAPALSLFLLLTAQLATSAPFQATSSNHGTITASSSSIGFGNIQVGSSRTQYETLTNSGNSTLTISQATVTGAGFGLSGLSLPLSLSKGQSITFSVRFTPKTGGNVSGAIAVFSNASNPNLAIALAGTGVPAGRLTSSASTLNFGGVAVGTSKSVTATLTATGSSVTISSATSTSAEFSLSGLSLPKTIAVGQSVSITLTFKPKSSGTASGSISLASNAANPSVVETLTGSGTAASHAVSLRWNPSTSAVVGYNVYRSSTSGGPYTKVNPILEASTNYVDSSVLGGKTYYYVSTAVKSGGAESQYSNQMQAVIPSP
jgi:HYDIN/CFA65/VesB-like, Ig-like domain/Abnormal spindle-like microcephaly-assoc'd, ASPM-SPD-2-Hydin